MRSTAPARLSTTSYAVLGLLSVRSWTTYELTQQVKRSLSWFWPRTERRLYDEPKRLVRDGLAVATREFTGQRPRTVYAITDEGRRELREWLDETPAPPSTEFEGVLKLFFADAGSIGQLDASLASVEAESTSRLSELAEVNESNLAGRTKFPERLHLSVLALRLHVEQEQAVRRWAQWARAQVSEWDSTTAAGVWDIDAAQHDVRNLARVSKSAALLQKGRFKLGGEPPTT
jgi:DNA-binding PadR family transcriptional regulator